MASPLWPNHSYFITFVTNVFYLRIKILLLKKILLLTANTTEFNIEPAKRQCLCLETGQI